MEPAEPGALARDILVKSRNRKGLTSDLSLVEYFSSN